MKEVIDRVPTRPNRIKLTSESDGSINYYAWERADEPITDGTPINKELFDSIGADITSLQQTTSKNTSDIATNKANIATNTNDIATNKANIATNTNDIAKLKQFNEVTLGTSWVQDTTNGYYTQTVALSGITSADNPIIDVVLSDTLENMQAQQEDWSKILKVETSTDALIFYASEVTTTALDLIVKIGVGTKSDADDIQTELIDIRVGYDGTTYDSAGNAVRTQVTTLNTKINGATSELKRDLVNLDNVIFSKVTTLTYDVIGNDFPNNGYINNQGTVPSSTDTNWKNTEFVEVEEGDRIEGHLSLGVTGIVCSVACYDINKTFMLDDSLLRMLDGEYIVPKGVHYVRFCHASTYSFNNFVKIYSKINKDNLKTIKNKVNLICIGDSYGIQNTDGDIEKFYWEYLRDGLGLEEGTDFFHKYKIGAGMGNGGYLEQIQLLDNSVTDKESITDILLCGGWNDSNTQNTGGTDTEFWNSAETFFAYIKEKYPNARVSIGHISWGRLGEGMRDQLNLSLARYKEMANKYGCRFLTNMESVLHIYSTEYWQSDSAHPNNEGHKLLGRHIVSAFISGSADVLYDSEISDFVTWGQALETIGKIYSEVNNNITRVWSASENGLIAINGFTNNGITPNGATEYGIAKITTKYFRGYRHHTFATTGCIILANGKYYHGSVRLRFDDDRVYARFYVPHDGLNNWLGNLTNIYIQDFDLSVATMKS